MIQASFDIKMTLTYQGHVLRKKASKFHMSQIAFEQEFFHHQKTVGGAIAVVQWTTTPDTM